MKTRILKMMALALIPAFALALTSGVVHSEPQGAIAVISATDTFTVQSVDAAKKEVTLKAPDGTVQTYKLGKEVRNFDQIKPGDQVTATVVDSLAVSVRKPGEPPSMGESQTVLLAPKGAKPGGVIANTFEVTATIQDIDQAKRQITFLGPQGKLQTVKVGPDVDLTKLKKGDNVVLKFTEAIAITVEKP